MQTNIFVREAETIRFDVSGKWSIWEQWQKTDYRGYMFLDSVASSGRLGCLLGRIEGGDEFFIHPGMTYTSTVAGKIYLYANNRGYEYLQGNGNLNVTVKGGKILSNNEIEKANGWDTQMLNTGESLSFLTKEEKELIIYINKLRTNPKRFAEQYLAHLLVNQPIAVECFELLHKVQPCGVLFPKEAMALAAKKHSEYIGKNALCEHSKNTFGENITFGNNKPLDIVLEMLFDAGNANKSNRKNLLDPDYQSIGVGLAPHSTFNFCSTLMFSYSK